MFEPIVGGTSEIIAHLTCWIPVQPEDKKIAGYGLPPEEQYWKRTPLPEWWGEKYRAEQIKKESDPTYFDPKLQEFRNQEWLRRLNGYWFFNNGIATYITGTCYFFMNWWKGTHKENGGYAIYNDEIRKRFYFRQYCLVDPLCLGYIIAGGRGFGKTFEETCCVVESLTKTPRKSHGAIQSKSEDDAKKTVFQKKIVPSYNDLPEFFKPTSNHGTHPEKGLSFFRDSVRGKGKKLITFGDAEELQNTIIPVPAKETYLSGGDYAEIFTDEIGITDPKKEADVYIRSQINRFCVYRNSKKVGLMRCTTTVEDMDKGGSQFKKVWDNSDQRTRTESGCTISGMYRYFVADVDSTVEGVEGGRKVPYLNKHGFFDKLKSDLFHKAHRRSLAHNHVELMSYIRKNPHEEAEMFIVKSNMCHFDAWALTQRFEAIKEMDILPYRIGNLQWVNNVRNTKVEWVPCFHPESEYEEDKDTKFMYCKHCRFVVSYLPLEGLTNRVTCQDFGDKKYYTPENAIKFTAGSDPYENTLLIDEGRGSKAGFYIKLKYDPLIDNADDPKYKHITDAPCLEYLCRPNTVFDMFEDKLKALWYYGSPVFPETNKPAFKEWMLQNGYVGFLVMKPKGITSGDDVMKPKTDGGAHSTTPMIQHYTDLIEADVKINCYKYPFPRLIFQLLHFDNSATTKFDACVAWGFTLVGAQKVVVEEKKTDDTKYWRTYDQYGQEIK